MLGTLSYKFTAPKYFTESTKFNIMYSLQQNQITPILFHYFETAMTNIAQILFLVWVLLMTCLELRKDGSKHSYVYLPCKLDIVQAVKIHNEIDFRSILRESFRRMIIVDTID